MASARDVDKWCEMSAKGTGTTRAVAAIVLAGALVVTCLPLVVWPAGAPSDGHPQLRLPPCMFRVLTGLPCPFCGLTTAFIHMGHGQIKAALVAHPLGPPLYVAAWVTALLAVRTLVTGRHAVPQFVLSRAFGWIVIVAILLAWGMKLLRHLL